MKIDRYVCRSVLDMVDQTRWLIGSCAPIGWNFVMNHGAEIDWWSGKLKCASHSDSLISIRDSEYPFDFSEEIRDMMLDDETASCCLCCRRPWLVVGVLMTEDVSKSAFCIRWEINSVTNAFIFATFLFTLSIIRADSWRQNISKHEMEMQKNKWVGFTFHCC